MTRTLVAPLRIALEIAAIASVVLSGWLWSVVLLVLPARDPADLPFWAGVAVLALAVAAASLTAIRRGGTGSRARVVLAIVAAVTAVLSVPLLLAAQEGSVRGDQEGYLLVVGAILAANGVLALGWLVVTNPGRR